ncbi:hypothetical protein Srut_03060 [Streptomyces rutgersensis]|nr:hypothetical protein Srut_03060 [Streptomyces rutgersensis]
MPPGNPAAPTPPHPPRGTHSSPSTKRVTTHPSLVDSAAPDCPISPPRQEQGWAPHPPRRTTRI